MPEEIDSAWQHLINRVRAPHIRSNKDGPMVSPAIFDPPQRMNGNVKALTAIFFDLDHDVPPIEEVSESLRPLQCPFVVYSTHSHLRKTEGNPKAERRLRVVIPLATPVPAESYYALRQHILERTKLPADRAASALSQMFYLPSKASADAPYEQHISSLIAFKTVEGPRGGFKSVEVPRFLDWDQLDLLETTPTLQSQPVSGPAPGNGHSLNGWQQLARKAKNWPEVERLWLGDHSGYNSQSEASLALCGHLAFYLNRDPQKIDAAFRQSGLMRPKWDRKDGDGTWGSRTIAKVLSIPGDVYSGNGHINERRCLPPLPHDDVEAKQKKSQAARLVEMAADTELFHNESGDAYGSFMQGDHLETSPLRAKAFRQYLAYRFYQNEQKVPSTQAIQDAIQTLSGMAAFDGPCREVSTRVAQHEDSIYIDLVNADWQIVKIDSSGYRIIESKDSPVRFKRTKGMKSLPAPVRGGSISALRGFINTTDAEWPLVAAYLVAALRPGLPCPVLAIHGPQGSAKTTTAEVIRELIDPNTVPLRSEPRDVRDLMIAANNSWIIALDNLSNIPGWLSDALCRLSTGGGFGTRQLFTDEDEILFDALRPMLFTGIVELANRSDLLDRAIVLTQPVIEECNRRPESTFWPEFERARPEILGGLYTTISSGLRHLSTIDSQGLSRMADFCLWGQACESALGLEVGQFMTAYRQNRETANDFALEASPVGNAILELMESTDRWEGFAAQLLVELEGKVSEETRKQKEWPKRAHFLTGKLKLIAPNLRATGICVSIGRTKKGSHITLEVTSGDAG